MNWSELLQAGKYLVRVWRNGDCAIRLDGVDADTLARARQSIESSEKAKGCKGVFYGVEFTNVQTGVISQYLVKEK